MAEQVHYRTLPRMKRNRAITESAESDHSTDDTASSDFSRTSSKSLDDLSLFFPRPPILAEERAKFTSEVMSKRKKIGQEIEVNTRTKGGGLLIVSMHNVRGTNDTNINRPTKRTPIDNALLISSLPAC